MTTFDEYMKRVMAGDYPAEPRLPVHVGQQNASGVILNLAHGQFGGVAIIESRPRTLRSNHYHKTDWHFIYVVEGRLHYYHRPVGSSASPEMEVFQPGDLFFTPPMVEHAVWLPGHSKIISVSRLARSHETHEGDLVRVKLVDVADAKAKP